MGSVEAANLEMSLEEVEVVDEEDILWEARARAGRTTMSRGHRGPGEGGDLFRAHVCKGSGGAHVNTGDVDRTQCSEGSVVRVQFYEGAVIEAHYTEGATMLYVSPKVL